MSAPTLPIRHTVPEPGSATTVADGLSSPGGVAFGPDGTAYVSESGRGHVWRLSDDGTRTLLSDELRTPITGLVFADGALWVSQGGPPGRISRLSPDGSIVHVLTDLPGGDHHVGEVAVGPDGKLYFGLGSLTNSGIVGPDTIANGWTPRRPASLDVPGYDIVLNDVRVRTPDGQITGPFSAYGEVVHARTHVLGARFWGRPFATAAVHRANPDGSGVELVCWGLRDPFGLRFLPDGRLLALDRGAADRGSRPVGGIPDFLWDVREGAWYGWPDYFGGRPVTDPAFRPSDGSTPAFLLADHHELPPPERPLTAFGATATAFDVDPASGGLVVAVALVRADGTASGAPRSAIALVRTADGAQRILPAPELGRVVDVHFHPDDGALWVVDDAPGDRRGGRVLRLPSRFTEV